ncbi:hypothetical protein AX17_005149 [Amanita inopinata Kibby_2008]|nr:hypothetical protein AX17_005149 [Amanita inopinata Kibby_2008]
MESEASQIQCLLSGWQKTKQDFGRRLEHFEESVKRLETIWRKRGEESAGNHGSRQELRDQVLVRVCYARLNGAPKLTQLFFDLDVACGITKTASKIVSILHNTPTKTSREAPVQTICVQNVKDSQQDGSTEPPLPPLLMILRNRVPGAKEDMENYTTAINLMGRLLRMKSYTTVGLQLTDAKDIENLLDFIVNLLRHGDLLHTGIPDVNRKARRLMLKLLTKASIIPKSLYLPNVMLSSPYSIAHGGFADIYVGKYRHNRVALKRLKSIKRDTDFCREALIWRSLSHAHVLPFFGVHYEEESKFLYLVSPFMENGSLIEWRKKWDPSPIEIEKRILEVAEGVQYLHSEGIVHGDLRGENILLDSDLRARITDFGLTRLSDATATKLFAWSPNFSAPEILFELFDELDDDCSESIIRTEKMDVFAFACLYYQVHFGALPFEGKDDFMIVKLVRNGKRGDRLTEPKMEDRAWKLINRCWKTDPTRRPTMEDIVEMMTDWQSSRDIPVLYLVI